MAARVAERDGWKCHWCPPDWPPLDPAKATVDHVIPRIYGGTSALANLVLSCKYHNGRRSDTPYAVYRRRCGLPPNPEVEQRAKRWREGSKTGDKDNRRVLGVNPAPALARPRRPSP